MNVKEITLRINTIINELALLDENTIGNNSKAITLFTEVFDTYNSLPPEAFDSVNKFRLFTAFYLYINDELAESAAAIAKCDSTYTTKNYLKTRIVLSTMLIGFELD